MDVHHARGARNAFGAGLGGASADVFPTLAVDAGSRLVGAGRDIRWIGARLLPPTVTLRTQRVEFGVKG